MLRAGLYCCVSLHTDGNERGAGTTLSREWETPSRTYLLSHYVVPVVVQNGFHFQAICKGGVIQTVVQANVDWR